ncbi:hypothetical protein [Rubrobacter indicoceani]|uniref:hypothetical protein n=1 Tax=Rubrobacter indicoceani TaxID=2051957 RepID=UPI0013C41BA1|nr:hypothetical protein [Rubrobacter indicoceani]
MARRVDGDGEHREDVRVVDQPNVPGEPVHERPVHNREPVRKEVEFRQTGGNTSPRDSVRWGPIWAGLITTIAAFVSLQLLAFGLGLLTLDLDPGAGGDGASAWVSGIIGLIAFFTGGAVAGMTSATRGVASGLLNGLMVWALGTVLILFFSSLGLGQIFGALGNLVSQLGALSSGALSLQGADVDSESIVSTLRTGALYAFFSLLLAAIASTIGGILAGRSGHPIGYTADTSHHA